MTAHPNRSTWRAFVPEPSPAEIRALRGSRTQEQMAELAGVASQTRWAEFESGIRRPHWALWELALLRTGQHPTLRLARKRLQDAATAP